MFEMHLLQSNGNIVLERKKIQFSVVRSCVFQLSAAPCCNVIPGCGF